MTDDNKPTYDFLEKEVRDLKKQIEHIEEVLAENADPAEALRKEEEKQQK